jgi:hypothetical protein
MAVGRFRPHRGPDVAAQIRHIEMALDELSAQVAKLNGPLLAARNTGNAGAAQAAGGGSGSSGSGGVLAGDVTGPLGSNTAVQASGDFSVFGVTTTEGFRGAVVTKTANYTLVYTDYAVDADTTSGGFTLTLPTAVGHAGQEFVIKKGSGDLNLLTVAGTGGELIDGSATVTILMPESSLGFRSTGAAWAIF